MREVDFCGCKLTKNAPFCDYETCLNLVGKSDDVNQQNRIVLDQQQVIGDSEIQVEN